MKNYHNIETQKNRDGSRTGYDGTGRSWRIRGAYGCWSAIASHTVQGRINIISGYKTLAEISELLAEIK